MWRRNHCGAQQVTRAWQVEGAGRRRLHHRSGHPHGRGHVHNAPGRDDHTRRGSDAVAVLQSDIDQFTGTASAILGNVRTVNAPGTKALQSANFQQEAFTEYTADVLTQQGTILVIGIFSELLNTSNGRSALIDFRQDSSATTQAAGDGGTMIDSML
jgi:hypothetical protein